MKVKELKTKLNKGLLVLAVVITALTANPISPVSNSGGSTAISLQENSTGEVVAGTNFGMDVITPPLPIVSDS